MPPDEQLNEDKPSFPSRGKEVKAGGKHSLSCGGGPPRIPHTHARKRKVWASVSIVAALFAVAGYFFVFQKPTGPPHGVNEPDSREKERVSINKTESREDTNQDSETASIPDEFTFIKKETFSCGGQKHAVKIYQHDRTGLEFVLIPGGSIEMRADWRMSSSHDYDSVIVTIEPFLICRTEVTQEVWDKTGGKDDRHWNGKELPIETVTWYECAKWCEKAGLRLPTAAEWKYACCAGTTSSFCFGDSDSDLHNFGNYCDRSNTEDDWRDIANNDGHDKTAPVRSYKPNAFGLFDMHGYVCEWSSSSFYGDYTGMPSDGFSLEFSPPPCRYIYGGSWWDTASYCHSASACLVPPDWRDYIVGFRPARSCH